MEMKEGGTAMYRRESSSKRGKCRHGKDKEEGKKCDFRLPKRKTRGEQPKRRRRGRMWGEVKGLRVFLDHFPLQGKDLTDGDLDAKAPQLVVSKGGPERSAGRESQF